MERRVQLLKAAGFNALHRPALELVIVLSVAADGVPIPLWDGPAPGSESWTHAEQVDGSSLVSSSPLVRNVVVPTATPYLPTTRPDRAVVVCPGGAMHFLGIEHEGSSVAELLRAAGLAAFLLKYRVVPTSPEDEHFAGELGQAFRAGIGAAGASVLPLAVADAERAVELARAEGYSQVTLLGFSAGARLTAEIILRSPADRRPDLAAVCYLSSVENCAADGGAPPLFVLAAADDPLGIEGSLSLHRAWMDACAPVELHLFDRGGHGFGTNATGLPVDHWPELLLAWLASRQA